MSFLAHTALAQTFTDKIRGNSALMTLMGKIMNAIVVPIIEGLFAFAILVFIWGVVGLIRSGDDPTARKEGQNHILWGVVGMFIMVSAFGIIRLIGNTTGVGDPFQ